MSESGSKIPRTPIQLSKDQKAAEKDSDSDGSRMDKLEAHMSKMDATMEMLVEHILGNKKNNSPDVEKKQESSSSNQSSDSGEQKDSHQSKDHDDEDDFNVTYNSDNEVEEKDLRPSWNNSSAAKAHASRIPRPSRKTTSFTTPQASGKGYKPSDTLRFTPGEIKTPATVKKSSNSMAPPRNSTDVLRQTIISTAPAYDFKLNSLKISKILEMKNWIYDYEQKYHLHVRVHLLLSDKVKNRLRNEHAVGMSKYAFDYIEEEEIYAMIKISALPKNPEDWVRYFKEAIEFPELQTYQPNISNFFMFYQACLTYSHSFMDVYDILKDADEFAPAMWTAQKIPGYKAQDETLVKLFLEQFPYDTGYGLHKLLIDKHRPKTMPEYIQLFVTQLKYENDKCEELQRLNKVLYDWKKKMLPQKASSSLQFVQEQQYARELDKTFYQEMCHISDNGKLGPNGCFHVMRTGNYCPFGKDCKRSHKPADLEETRKHWVDAISKIKYSESTVITSEKPGSANSKQFSILKRPGAEASKVRTEGYQKTDTYRRANVHALDLNDTDDEDEDRDEISEAGDNDDDEGPEFRFSSMS